MLFTKRLISLFLFVAICFSIGKDSHWNPLMQKALAAPSPGFKITQNTLGHLKREGVSAIMVEMLSALINQVYTDRKTFLDAMPIVLTPKKMEVLLRYASLNQLKVQADEFTSDLKNNEAVFRGNVQGFIPRENIELKTAKLRLVSGLSEGFEKLIGEGGVQVKQWDREIRSDYAVYTQIEELIKTNKSIANIENLRKPEQNLLLKGNVLMKATQGDVKSENVNVDLLKQYAIIEGKDSSREGRININANLSELEKGKADNKSVNQTISEKQTAETLVHEPKKISLKASRAVLDNEKHEALFEGDVELERTPEKLYISAGRVTIKLGEFQQLISLHAENKVCFEQPGRVAKADQASFNEVEQTILLEGNAEVQSGKYHLQGSTINLYLDVNKGIAQGDNKAPIQMTIMGDQSQVTFNCR